MRNDRVVWLYLLKLILELESIFELKLRIMGMMKYGVRAWYDCWLNYLSISV